MSQHRAAVFGAVRPWLDAAGFSPARVAALDAVLAQAGIPPDDAAAAPAPSPSPAPAGPVAGPIALIDAALLKVACPECQLTDLEAWVEPIRRACVRFEINTVRRVAAFIAQMAHESGLQPRTENLNYSVQALTATFGPHRISAADAARVGRSAAHPADQVAIANLVYGGDWGRHNLGNTEPGDGWLCRGVGPLQVTGRGNLTKFAAAMGMTLQQALAYAQTLEGGIMAAAWFWEENDINRLADTPGVTDETRRINGGVNGLADRTARFDAVVAALLAKGA